MDTTTEWQRQFLKDVDCFDADDAPWTFKRELDLLLSERRIFMLKKEAAVPIFQFDGHGPLPVIAKVLAELPEEETGWLAAFFFAEPNPFIGGRTPIALVRIDPDRVVSLAHAFANPGEPF